MSCNDDEQKEIEPKEEAIVQIYYKLDQTDKKYIDVNSTVYVYYNISEELYSDVAVRDIVAIDGIFVDLDGNKIYPDESYKTDHDGIVKFIPKESDNILTIVTISNFYNKVSVSRFLPKYVDFTMIYGPYPENL